MPKMPDVLSAIVVTTLVELVVYRHVLESAILETSLLVVVLLLSTISTTVLDQESMESKSTTPIL